LTTLLDRVDGRAPLLLELKNWGAPGELERQVAAAIDSYEGPVAVQSFNPRSMAWFQRHRPQVPRGQVSGPLAGIALARYKKELVKRLLVNAISRPAFVAYEHDALPYWPVTIARRLGLPILGWTIRSPEELGTARPHVDNVIFEGFEP
jgi:glycerophosphoryl diester phosphodiesterase